MKRKLFVFSIVVSIFSSVFAQNRQDTEFFTKEIFVTKNDTTIILYEKGNCEQPRLMLGHSVKNARTLYENMAVILEKVFPEKPDPQTLSLIKGIDLHLVYNGRGEIRFYTYRMSPSTYRGIPDLERKLYRFITEFKAKGMLDYDISPEGAPLDSCSFAGCSFRPAIRLLWQPKD